MPNWHCPHCGIPQPESARCWVCHRSTTLCGTCRHFRRAIAPGLGLCALDPRRPALRAGEMRPCWTAAVAEPAAGGGPADTAPDAMAIDAQDSAGQRSPSGRTFVPVDELVDGVPSASTEPPAEPAIAVTAVARRWTLWAEPDS